MTTCFLQLNVVTAEDVCFDVPRQKYRVVLQSGIYCLLTCYLDIVGEESTSAVRATWEDDNNIIATVKTQDEIYVIEPSWRHLPESDNHTMIVYKKSDVKMDEDMG